MATVSFDLDGVLIQNPFAAGVFPRVRAALRNSPALKDLDPDEADELINSAIRDEWGRRMTSGDFVPAYDWDSIFQAVSRDLGGGEVPDVAGLVEELCGVEGMIALLPGARECLEEMREADFRLVAATNGYHAYQWPVLKALGIADLFDDLLSPDRTGSAKPAPEFFAGVADLFAHVGDTLEHDVLGANDAGLLSLWFAPALPTELREVDASARTSHPAFRKYLDRALQSALYRQFHDAPDERFVPDLVAAKLTEIPEMLLAERHH